MKHYGLFASILLLTGCHAARTGSTQYESATFDLDKSELTRVELRMGLAN
jgi:hypothetical protein